jgi:hypothetical protein
MRQPDGEELELLNYVKDDPLLLSLLYDLDLMPEQTVNTKKYYDTLTIINHWREAFVTRVLDQRSEPPRS